jgi:hypothetical protein
MLVEDSFKGEGVSEVNPNLKTGPIFALLKTGFSRDLFSLRPPRKL